MAKKKNVARFRDVEKTIQKVVSDALYDRDKYDELTDGRKSTTLTQHADIFTDTDKFEKTKEALLKGTGQFKDWGDNIRFKTFAALIGTREAYAAGLEYTVADSYDAFTDEPEDSDDEDEDEPVADYSDDEDFNFTILEDSNNEPTTRTEYTEVY